MKQIRLPKTEEMIVNITYEYKDTIILQHFDFHASNKRYLSYIYDKRFSLKPKVDKLLKDANKTSDDIHFIQRVDEKGHIEVQYQVDNKHIFKPILKCIPFFVPPYTSCIYCQNTKVDNNVFFCKEKNKWYKSPCKSCKVFVSKEEEI